MGEKWGNLLYSGTWSPNATELEIGSLKGEREKK